MNRKSHIIALHRNFRRWSIGIIIEMPLSIHLLHLTIPVKCTRIRRVADIPQKINHGIINAQPLRTLPLKVHNDLWVKTGTPEYEVRVSNDGTEDSIPRRGQSFILWHDESDNYSNDG
mmetsp:Transcript_14256/g.21599  ORF Transcript_14256/g.21599 Transcript_14256/m.21599 type:complete len:118 (-) Transcript_14256:367-720(-)